MQVLSSPKTLKKLVALLRKKNKSIGFVPTMGSLHEGHLTLAKKSIQENNFTIASIFVNPLQFGPREDFKRYPRHLIRDKKLLREAGVDALFLPDADEFYPKDFQTTVSLSRLSQPLCGKSRPGHFSGVATVIMKLLNLTSPDRLYLGLKDYQQCRVVEQMVEDMGLSVLVCRVPIAREKDGLAMSSRNFYLSAQEREQAVILSRALSRAHNFIRSGQRNVGLIKKEILQTLRLASLGRVDYAEIVNARTLESVVKLKKGDEVVVALAVYFSKTRLIDNLTMSVG